MLHSKHFWPKTVSKIQLLDVVIPLIFWNLAVLLAFKLCQCLTLLQISINVHNHDNYIDMATNGHIMTYLQLSFPKSLLVTISLYIYIKGDL